MPTSVEMHSASFVWARGETVAAKRLRRMAKRIKRKDLEMT